MTLPALLGIARTENHPFAAAARGNLELFLNRDLGEDWEAWAGEVRRYLDLPLEEEAPGAVPVQ